MQSLVKILQWGVARQQSNNSFPLSFPTALYSMSALDLTPIGETTMLGDFELIGIRTDYTKNTFYIEGWNLYKNDVAVSGNGIFYIALGF